MVNIKNFDPNLLDVDKISFKTNDAVFCNIRYITMKSLVNINSENPIYLNFSNEDDYIG